MFLRPALIILIVSLFTPVFAFGVSTSTIDVSLTPDSPLYFLKTWKEQIQLFFTFNAEQKAKQYLHLAEVRLAEYQKMIEKDKTNIAEKTLNKYEDQLNRALSKAEELKNKGKDIKDLSQKVGEATSKNLQVLQENLTKVPEAAKKGIEKAIEASSKGIEKVREVLEKKSGVDTSTWQTYRNQQYSFSLDFPDRWKGYQVKEEGNLITFSLKHNGGFYNAIFTVGIFPKVEWLEIISPGMMNRFSYVAEKDGMVFSYELGMDDEGYIGFPEVVPGQVYQGPYYDVSHKIIPSFKFISPNSEVDVSNWKTYHNEKFGIGFKIPSAWIPKPGYEDGAVGGYLYIDALSGESSSCVDVYCVQKQTRAFSIDEVVQSQTAHKLGSPFGDNPTISKMTIGGQEARFIHGVGGNGLIVRYPSPLKIGNDVYRFLIIQFLDGGHEDEIIKTFKFIPLEKE